MAFNVRQIFAALNDAKVDYVVVGGMAVILHGYLRATADLDLVIGLVPDNCKRGLQALASIGFKPRLLSPSKNFPIRGNGKSGSSSGTCSCSSCGTPPIPCAPSTYA